MSYLTPEASATYFEISKRSFMLGILSWGQLLSRLVTLSLLCKPHDVTLCSIQEIIRLEPQTPADDWPNGEWSAETSDRTTRRDASPAATDDDVIFRFIPDGKTGLSIWEFHPYDTDYFPSVPHGHYQGRPQPKLDAYLGWVYSGSRQISREPRSKIVAL